MNTRNNSEQTLCSAGERSESFQTWQDIMTMTAGTRISEEIFKRKLLIMFYLSFIPGCHLYVTLETPTRLKKIVNRLTYFCSVGS